MGKNTGGVEEGCISIGPWGGQEGESWAYKANGRITHVIVCHGMIIDSISFQAESCDGTSTLQTSDKFGGSGGNRTDKVCIDGMVEHLTAISMTFGDYRGHSAITSLCFHTNLNEYGPFGLPSGTSVSIPIEGGVFFGFHGWAGKYLSAIGIYVAPKIMSLQQTGGQESAPTHQKVELDSGDEIIVAIEGFYGAVKGTDGLEVITSLSIFTNRRKYGPFGEKEIGTHFSSTLSGGKVVGFFGRSGTYLNAIGVHMEYC